MYKRSTAVYGIQQQCVNLRTLFSVYFGTRINTAVIVYIYIYIYHLVKEPGMRCCGAIGCINCNA